MSGRRSFATAPGVHLAMIFLLVCAMACSSAPSPEPCASWPAPGTDWKADDPAAHGFDPAKLNAAADYAASNSSRCLVVVRDDRIVGEWYWNGTTRTSAIPTWSLAKSYTSTLVGIAVDEGLIKSIDDPAERYLPQWRDGAHDGVTIRHLLSMTSGLQFDSGADSVEIVDAKDMDAQALALPVTDRPGTTWRYSNQAVQVLEPVLRDATGKDLETFAQEKLWGPLGFQAHWQHDAAGHVTTYMNVLATCRDHARFGELFLHRGCWGSKRVVSSKWVAEATTPSSSLNRGYGLLWWLNAGTPVLDSVTFKPEQGRLHPYAPADDYCAEGLGSEMIEVVPSLDLVVVRAGFAPQDDPALAGNPLGQAAATLEDGKQLVHNGVLERVLQAIVR